MNCKYFELEIDVGLHFNLNFLITPLTAALTFCYQLTAMLGAPSYGLAIIMLTVVIKMLLYPLMVKQIRSMKAMQDLQPQMQEIKEKYKDNKEKLQKEMAGIYKAAGVNPLGNFVTLLIQMPILTAIFYAIREYKAMAGSGFLWLPDLARGASITVPSDPYFILPLLCALTTYFQQKQTSMNKSQQNQMMLLLMPIFVGYMAISFPAGLGLYWAAGNMVQLLQQRWIYGQAGLTSEAVL